MSDHNHIYTADLFLKLFSYIIERKNIYGVSIYDRLYIIHKIEPYIEKINAEVYKLPSPNLEYRLFDLITGNIKIIIETRKKELIKELFVLKKVKSNMVIINSQVNQIKKQLELLEISHKDITTN